MAQPYRIVDLNSFSGLPTGGELCEISQAGSASFQMPMAVLASARTPVQITSGGTTNASLTVYGDYLVQTSSAVTINLPSALLRGGVPITIAGNHTAPNVTVAPFAGQTIFGSSSSIKINEAYQSVTLWPDATGSGDWYVKSNLLPTLTQPFLLTPEQFGAVGDGVTDDTAAVNAAIAQAISNNIAGNSNYGVFCARTYLTTTGFTATSPSAMLGFSMKGIGKNHPTLITNSNVPVLTFNCTAGNFFAPEVSDMSIVGSSGFTSANHGIVFSGNNSFSYYVLSGLHIQGCYNAIYFSSNVGTSDWGIVNDCDLRNNYRGIYRLSGGTGSVYWGNNIICSGSPDGNGAAITIGVSGSAVIGDISIGGIQMGGTAAGIVMNDVSGTYGSNVSIVGCQFDAGINPGFHLTNIHGPNIAAINYGGGSGPQVIDGTSNDTDLQENNLIQTSVGSTTLNNVSVVPGQGGTEYVVTGGLGDLTITGLAGGYDSRRFEVYNLGTTGNVILKNENTGSTATNRFHLGGSGGADVTLTPGQSIFLRYVSNSSLSITGRWIRRGGS